MFELKEIRVVDFDAAGPDDYQVWRREDEGLETVSLYRTEFARWEDPDAAEPDKLGTLMVVWEVVEKDCECSADPADEDEECVCDDLEAAVLVALRDHDVFTDSHWEASCYPDWESQALGTVWVSAYEKYQYESGTRYEYSLHVEGVSAGKRSRIFGAVGVVQKGDAR